jgi:hypothetical protein
VPGESIATEVRISNDGASGYDYHYTWCVTDSETNLCGSGDGADIFSSTAAEWIGSGNSFDTTLNSTVPVIGSYWFHLSAQYGSKSSRAYESFTAVAVTVTPPATPSTGGGGGGGSVPTPSAVRNAADFNNDGRVDSVDFSIMLFFWKTKSPFANPYVDINGDKQVDSVEFSILMYQWGK